jgi:hypothetical protein
MVCLTSSDVGTVMWLRRRQVGWDGVAVARWGSLWLSYRFGVASNVVGQVSLYLGRPWVDVYTAVRR